MTLNHKDALLMNNEYGHHVHRAWVDTHSQSIRTDLEIYLPGELNTREEEGNSDGNDNDDDRVNQLTWPLERRGRQIHGLGVVFPARSPKLRLEVVLQLLC